MDTPSPTERRQAWVRSRQFWFTMEETDGQGWQGPFRLSSQTGPKANTSLKGCSTGKIESWLQGCGHETGFEDSSNCSAEASVKAGGSFEDDLSLGAEAMVLSFDDESEIRNCPVLLPPPRPRNKYQTTSTPLQKLSVPLGHLGHSMASSCPSSATSLTASSVSEVLQLRMEDAEDTLYQLGFGCDDPQPPGRIPCRFFSFPSKLKGINFRLFLESQLRRLKEEDPGLSLASRFRQVEVLTAMANAFYSLYSHVSRTPLQKLAPPEFSFSQSPTETMTPPRFFSTAHNEPKSPVERLKDTVSKMCLYSGPSLRSPDYVLPHSSPSKHRSLPDLTENILGEESMTQVHAVECVGRSDKTTDTVPPKCQRPLFLPSKLPETHKDNVNDNPAQRAPQGILSPTMLFPVEPPTEAPTAGPVISFFRIAKITHDTICPPIVEHVQLAPFGYNQMKQKQGFPEQNHSQDRKEELASSIPKTADQELQVGKESEPLAYTWTSPCSITVTSTEEDVVLPPSKGNIVNGAWMNQGYLGIVKPPALGRASKCPQMGNSFELEEVHSAGEDDSGQTEMRHSTASLPLSAVKRHRDMLLRDDSLQSDSSGYAEEDVQPLSASTVEDGCS